MNMWNLFEQNNYKNKQTNTNNERNPKHYMEDIWIFANIKVFLKIVILQGIMLLLLHYQRPQALEIQMEIITE